MRRPQKTMENRRKPFKSLKILKEKKTKEMASKGDRPPEVQGEPAQH
jgi:hypothetical protein